MTLIKLKSKKQVAHRMTLNFKNLFLKIALIIFCYILLAFSELTHQGIKSGIYLCTNMLIPSLFPFMILAAFTANSRLFDTPNPLFSKITEKLFYLPGYTYPAIILSFLGGYPVGAKIVKSLYENKKINTEQLNRMMCFCVSSGPAFTISLLGGSLLKNKKIGLIIFLIQIITGILIGIACALKSRFSKEIFYTLKSASNTRKNKFQEAFVISVASACESMIQMCGIVIIFVACINILENFRLLNFESLAFINIGMPQTTLKAIIISVLEVTLGCTYAAKNNVPFWILAFAIGYGGICTHFQIASILKGSEFKYQTFCIFRWINATISGFLFYLVSCFLEFPTPVFSTINESQTTISSSSTPIGSAALLMLCFYFLLTIKSDKY